MTEKRAAATLRTRPRLALKAGCGCLVAVAVVAVLAVFFVPKTIWELAGAVAAAKSERDRIYFEALSDGDANAAYGRADERFRQAYTAEQLAEYFAGQPSLFDPPRSSVSLNTQTVNGKTVMSTTFAAGQDRYTIYVVKDEGGLRLLGVTPELDQAVPSDFKRERL
jgi:hypothetical protein